MNEFFHKKWGLLLTAVGLSENPVDEKVKTPSHLWAFNLPIFYLSVRAGNDTLTNTDGGDNGQRVMYLFVRYLSVYILNLAPAERQLIISRSFLKIEANA